LLLETKELEDLRLGFKLDLFAIGAGEDGVVLDSLLNDDRAEMGVLLPLELEEV
jgi:hypothetical protein